MPDISSIGNGFLDPLNRPGALTAYQQTGSLRQEIERPRSSDRVELSDHARFIDKLNSLPEGRTNLVEAVQQAIIEGSYETEEKLNLAVSRLIEEIHD